MRYINLHLTFDICCDVHENDTALVHVNRFRRTEYRRWVRTSQTTVDWASAMMLYRRGLLRMIMKMHCCLDSTWRTFNSSSSALLRSASLHAAGCVELKLEFTCEQQHIRPPVTVTGCKCKHVETFASQTVLSISVGPLLQSTPPGLRLQTTLVI